MKLNALTVLALRSGTTKAHDVPATLEDALALAIINHANAHMLMKRAEQLETATETASEPDIAEHYFVSLTPGIVASPILDRVVAAYDGAGWTHTRIVGNTLVIARTEYVVTKGRGAPGETESIGPRPMHDTRQMVRPLPGQSFAETAK